MTAEQDVLVLVTGAAGCQQGSTGNRIVHELLDRGFRVRAFVRHEGDRSAVLRSHGAELHIGDILDFASVSAAMKNVRRLHFCYPIQAGLLNASSIFAAIAREAGVEVIVNLSQGSASETALSPTSCKHWLAEQIFNCSGLPLIQPRGAVFYENLFGQTQDVVYANGTMPLPSGAGDTIIPLIAGEDVARAGAALLSEPHGFIGQTLNVTGPETLTAIDCAEGWSTVLGKPVRYQWIKDDEQRANLERQLGTANSVQIEHLSRLWMLLRNADIQPGGRMGTVSPVLRMLTGSAGSTWVEFLRQRVVV